MPLFPVLATPMDLQPAIQGVVTCREFAMKPLDTDYQEKIMKFN